MKKPFYVEVGGSRLGKSFWLGFGQRFAINSTWPKAKIEIYKDYITLKGKSENIFVQHIIKRYIK